MKKSRQKKKRKSTSLWHQIYTRHFLLFSFYTVAVVIVSSCITSFVFLAGVNFLQRRLLEQTLLVKPLEANKLLTDSTNYEEKTTESDNNPSNQADSAGIILHGPRDKKEIALTFDAEMTNGMKENLLSGKVKSSYNQKITDILIQTQTKATFFLTGMWIELYPDITKKLADDPLFELGSHSYADTSYDGYCFGLTQIKEGQYLEEIETTQKLLRDVAGVENKYFRFPGGCYSQNSKDVVMNTAGLKIVHWDVSGMDGFTSNTEQIVNDVVNHVQNGSIIVLHLNGAPTAPKTSEALFDIISKLRQKGFNFVKISELLN